MIKSIITILRKYLDLSREEWNNMDAILTDIPNFDIIAGYPCYDMLRRMAHDLIKVMGMEKCEKHIRIPDQKSTIKFVKSIMPTATGFDDYLTEEFLDYHAKHLRRWLLNWNTTMRTYRERRPMEPPIL